MPVDSVKIVRDGLQAYADRGVFRGFAEQGGNSVTKVFTFVWLTKQPMRLTLDTTKGVLRFANLLPNIPARSDFYTSLKQFVNDRYDKGLPAHRRIDRKRAEIICQNRLGSVSVGLRVIGNQYRYAIGKIVNIVHELFVHLNDLHADYMHEAFDAPQE